MSQENPFVCSAKNPFAFSPESEKLPKKSPLEQRLDLIHWGNSTTTSAQDRRATRRGAAIEIVVSWGASVLHVEHLDPPRDFTIVGTEVESIESSRGSDEEGADLQLPLELLGRRLLPLVSIDEGVAVVTFPEGTEGVWEDDRGQEPLSRRGEGEAETRMVSDLSQRRLSLGDRASLVLPGVEIRVSLVRQEKPLPGFLSHVDWSAPSYFGVSAAVGGALLASMAYFVPPQGLTDEDALDHERLLYLSQMLDASSEKDRKRIEQESSAQEESNGGTSGEQAAGPSGKAGRKNLPQLKKRVAVKGPPENKKLQLTREEAIRIATTEGLVGMLNSASDAPISVFGADLAIGSNFSTAQGDMWAREIGESGGIGALGPSGDGFGGGDIYGNGVGVGLNRVGTIGPGGGDGGFGTSVGRSGREHKTRAPSIKRLGETVSGRIPPHVVQRVVRQNFGRFRHCYTQGLARNPSLEGRVSVRFVIGRDGAVSNVSAGGGFPDSQVSSCVATAFYGLSFPPPEEGVVKVTYPLMFSPQ